LRAKKVEKLRNSS